MLTTRNTPIRGPIGQAVSKLAYHPAGPTVLAVALALISLPFVAVTLQVYEMESTGFQIADIHPLAPADPARWTAAASAVLLSALVAGSAGGWLLRHRSGYSYWVALLLAWICGIGSTTLLPSLLGQHFGAVPLCIDGCGYGISTGAPGPTFVAAALFCWLGPISEGPAFGILVVGFIAWSQILTRFGPAAPPPDVPRWQRTQQAPYPLPGPYAWPHPVAPTDSAAPPPGPVRAPATPPTQLPDNGHHKAG